MLKLLTTKNAKWSRGDVWGYRTCGLALLPATMPQAMATSLARWAAGVRWAQRWLAERGHPATPSDVVRSWREAMAAGQVDLCPRWTPGCRVACIAGTGRMIMRAQRTAQLGRTLLWLHRRPEFIAGLRDELSSLARLARRKHEQLCWRPNVVQDLDLWSGPMAGVVRHARSEGISVYAYTKRQLPWLVHGTEYEDKSGGVHVVFSLAEDNRGFARLVYARGRTPISVVVRSKDGAAEWSRAVDGDISDLRHLDPPGSVVLLGAKGRAAKRDSTGFVLPDVEAARDALGAWRPQDWERYAPWMIGGASRVRWPRLRKGGSQ